MIMQTRITDEHKPAVAEGGPNRGNTMKRIFFAMICLASLAATATAADKWKDLTEKDGLPGVGIQFLRQDSTGTIWIGTETGLGVFKDGNFSVVFKDRPVWDVFELGGGKFLVGTSRGATLLGGAQPLSFLADSTVTGFVRYDANTVWAIAKDPSTGRNALVAFDGAGFAPVAALKDQKITGIYRTSDGVIWISISGNGLIAVDPKTGPAAAARHLQGAEVTAMKEDSGKRLWFGLSQRGLLVYDGKGFTPHLTREAKGSTILAIEEDAKGTLWAATNDRGLFRYQGDTWTHDLKDESGISTMQPTSDGRIWISSQTIGGLRYWDGAKWVVSLESPMMMRCILETKDKQIWAGGILDGLHIKK